MLPGSFLFFISRTFSICFCGIGLITTPRSCFPSSDYYSALTWLGHWPVRPAFGSGSPSSAVTEQAKNWKCRYDSHCHFAGRTVAGSNPGRGSFDFRFHRGCSSANNTRSRYLSSSSRACFSHFSVSCYTQREKFNSRGTAAVSEVVTPVWVPVSLAVVRAFISVHKITLVISWRSSTIVIVMQWFPLSPLGQGRFSHSFEFCFVERLFVRYTYPGRFQWLSRPLSLSPQQKERCRPVKYGDLGGTITSSPRHFSRLTSGIATS